MSASVSHHGPELSEEVFGPLHTNLIGKSASIRGVRELIDRLGPSNLSVLVTGETGTGKDIVAQLLHRKSLRCNRAFIKVNCPAIPDSLFESELFGYEKGAFTGARTPKPGRLELADKGTIFLDEVAEISPEAQSKLLLVLDGEPYMRIGGVKPVRSDARVIAATNVPIEEAIRQGRLRKEVCFRLSELVIHMLPLRERREDIPLLAEHFNFNFCKQYEKDYEPFSRELMERLQGQPWPGNVRELEARVKEHVANGAPLLPAGSKDVRNPRNGSSSSRSLDGRAVRRRSDGPDRKFVSLKEASRRAVEATEKALIEEALRYTLWNRRKAAKLLDISYSSLLRRIDIYEIGKV
ncbi:MAG TPA: sigma-54-dependent Fis family transcriptional regulator [Candidatus Hydrogenedentes bacterium]|nr:sigma-54-dependent Fis family transcriptional regulator [Candidatus Hydrogenedentota bacterium]HIJ72472.1 sigma-54-dependent Fis family transcriptional regulator [Candidatus Hydrogenedentota bacterium]